MDLTIAGDSEGERKRRGVEGWRWKGGERKGGNEGTTGTEGEGSGGKGIGGRRRE